MLRARGWGVFLLTQRLCPDPSRGPDTHPGPPSSLLGSLQHKTVPTSHTPTSMPGLRQALPGASQHEPPPGPEMSPTPTPVPPTPQVPLVGLDVSPRAAVGQSGGVETTGRPATPLPPGAWPDPLPQSWQGPPRTVGLMWARAALAWGQWDSRPQPGLKGCGGAGRLRGWPSWGEGGRLGVSPGRTPRPTSGVCVEPQPRPHLSPNTTDPGSWVTRCLMGTPASPQS